MKSILRSSGAACLLLSLAVACSRNGHSDAPGALNAPPTVLSNTPDDAAIDVPVNSSMSSTFSELMDGATLTDVTFTVVDEGTMLPVQGTVLYADSTAFFWPAAHLPDNGTFLATITTGAQDLAGLGLTAMHTWHFTTNSTIAPGQGVDLGGAGSFVILAKSGISTVPTSAVTGNLGVSPAAATAITAFDLILDATNVFATSSQVTGKVYASDYAPPTPDNLTTAVLAMQTAFTDAAGRAPDFTELGVAGDIGGMPPFAAGVYKWSTGVLISTDITLTGSATDVWIFQIAQDLTLSPGVTVNLAGNALPQNVYWQVSGLAALDTTAHINGIVLSATAITLNTGASVNGRLLAQTAVTLKGSTVVEPVP